MMPSLEQYQIEIYPSIGSPNTPPALVSDSALAPASQDAPNPIATPASSHSASPPKILADVAKVDENLKRLEELILDERRAREASKSPLSTPEKKKAIKFRDAVGRKYSFPFHLCNTWAVSQCLRLWKLPIRLFDADWFQQGMEELIHQAFLHIDIIGPHVAE